MLEFGGRSAGVVWVVRCGRLCGVVDIWFRSDRRERNGMGKHASLKKSEGKITSSNRGRVAWVDLVGSKDGNKRSSSRTIWTRNKP